MEKLAVHGKILVLGAVSLVLGVAFTILFYEQEPGLNFSIFAVLVVCSGLFLAYLFSRHIEREHYALMLCALFFSSMVFVRSSELLTFFNALGSLLLLLIVVGTFAGKHIKAYIPLDYIKAPFLPLRFIGPFFETFGEMLSLRRISGDRSVTKEIIRGSLMALVAIAVFAWLFASADIVFEKIFSSIVTFELDQEMVDRLILGLIATAFFIGAFGFMYRKIQPSLLSSPPEKPRNLGVIETMILLGSINVLFLIFILLQLASLFGGESHLLAAGLTYAEYARKGFFELVLVAVLSYLIISFAEKQIIKKENSHLRSFKILSGILVLQVILILISAFTRLSLYEEAYGFTDIRLYSHALMVWIAVVLVLLSHHIWTNGERALFAFRTFCTVVLLLFAMNMLDPDVFIAKKNLERYAATGQIDARYLGGLSEDALPYTIHLLDDPKQETRSDFATGLFYHYDGWDGPANQMGDHAWQSLRLSRANAQELLVQRKSAVKASMLLNSGAENSSEE